MNPANTSSEPTTAATSPSEHTKPQQPPHDRSDKAAPATAPGESEYLQQQAMAARQAVGATMASLKEKLGAGTVGAASDVMRNHPWLTAAGAAVAGFAVASMLTPSKTDQALKRLARIERALNPPPPVPHGAHVDSEGKAKVAKPGMGTVLIREFANVLKPTIMSLVTAGFTAKAASDAAEGQRQQQQASAAQEDQPVAMGDVTPQATEP